MDRVFNSDPISSDFLFKFFPSFSELFLRSIVDCCIISEFKISFLLGSQLFSNHFYITILLFNFIGDILRDVMDPAGGDAAEKN